MAGGAKDLSEILMLVIGNETPIRVDKADGGFARQALMEEAIAPKVKRVKHAAVLNLEPLVLEFGLAGSNPLLRWAAAMLRKDTMRRNIALYRAEADGTATFEYDGMDALITEFALPRMKRGVKAKVALRVKIQPQYMVGRKIAGQKAQWPKGTPQDSATGTFALKIDGLANLAKAVVSIEAISFKQGIKTFYPGSDKIPQLEPTKLDWPVLSIAVDDSATKAMIEWAKPSDVTKAPQPRTGSLTYFVGKSNTVVLRLNLYDVTPRLVQKAKRAGPTKVELVCGRIELDSPQLGMN